MTDNIIKSEDAAPKKKATVKDPVDKKIDESPAVEEVKSEPKAKKSPTPKKKVSAASDGKKFVYFDSGVAYVTKAGFRFTRENRIYEIDNDEADYLLSLTNFRLPTQLELEDHYKENN
jgi:hypothetical protein